MARENGRPPARAFYDGRGGMDARNDGRDGFGKEEKPLKRRAYDMIFRKSDSRGKRIVEPVLRRMQGIDFIIFLTLPKKISKKNRHIFYFSP